MYIYIYRERERESKPSIVLYYTALYYTTLHYTEPGLETEQQKAASSGARARANNPRFTTVAIRGWWNTVGTL